MMPNVVEIRIKLLNHFRPVLDGPLGHVTFPFPETKLPYKRPNDFSSNYSEIYSEHPATQTVNAGRNI